MNFFLQRINNPEVINLQNNNSKFADLSSDSLAIISAAEKNIAESCGNSVALVAYCTDCTNK